MKYIKNTKDVIAVIDGNAYENEIAFATKGDKVTYGEFTFLLSKPLEDGTKFVVVDDPANDYVNIPDESMPAIPSFRCGSLDRQKWEGKVNSLLADYNLKLADFHDTQVVVEGNYAETYRDGWYELQDTKQAVTAGGKMKNMVVFAHGKYISLPEGITGDNKLVVVILSGKAEGMVLFFRSTELRMVQLSGLLSKENSTRYAIQGSWGNKTTIVGAKIRYFCINQSYMQILGNEDNLRKSLQDWLNSLGQGYYGTATPDEWQESFYTFIKKSAEEGQYNNAQASGSEGEAGSGAGDGLSLGAFQQLVAADYKRD